MRIKIAIALFVALFVFACGADAQELDFRDDLAVGGGSLFGEEDTTFAVNTIFGAVHWRGLKLPLNSSTGIGIELSVKPDLDGENELVYTIWSLNRAEVVGGFYAGVYSLEENRPISFAVFYRF